jgi:hypothetical protein
LYFAVVSNRRCSCIRNNGGGFGIGTNTKRSDIVTNRKCPDIGTNRECSDIGTNRECSVRGINTRCFIIGANTGPSFMATGYSGIRIIENILAQGLIEDILELVLI